MENIVRSETKLNCYFSWIKKREEEKIGYKFFCFFRYFFGEKRSRNKSYEPVEHFWINFLWLVWTFIY